MSRFANGRLPPPNCWQGLRSPFDTQVAVAIGLTLSTSRARGCLQNEIRPGAAPYSGRPPRSTAQRESPPRTPYVDPNQVRIEPELSSCRDYDIASQRMPDRVKRLIQRVLCPRAGALRPEVGLDPVARETLPTG